MFKGAGLIGAAAGISSIDLSSALRRGTTVGADIIGSGIRAHYRQEKKTEKQYDKTVLFHRFKVIIVTRQNRCHTFSLFLETADGRQFLTDRPPLYFIAYLMTAD